MSNGADPANRKELNRVAFSATVHCLIGCAIGEVLGMVLAVVLNLGVWTAIALAVVLAFLFGYMMTLLPLLRNGMAFRAALILALASDTVSITIMEIVDNGIIVVIPGAMTAGLADGLFWGSLLLSLVVAGLAAFPVNRWLIAHGRGHALVGKQHHASGDASGRSDVHSSH